MANSNDVFVVDQSVCNFDHATGAVACSHHLSYCFTIFLDKYAACSSAFDDGASRYLQGIFVSVIGNSYAAKHAGFDAVLLIAYLDSDFEGTGCRINDWADTSDACKHRFTTQRVNLDSHRLTAGYLAKLALGYMKINDQRIKARYTKYRIAAVNCIA